MFCGRCGTELMPGARFCSQCGAPAAAAQGPQTAWGDLPMHRLERPRSNRVIAGVCAGLAMHYRWDVTWVRVLAVLVAVFSSGAGIVAYIVFWIIMPEQPLFLPAPGSVIPPGPPTPPI